MRSRCATATATFVRLNRRNVKFPPSVYNRFSTSYPRRCGTVARVEIERATGNVRIAKAYSVVECGRRSCPRSSVGQMQGGFAMGVGYALLENLPPYEDGPGNGKWNLGQYRLRARLRRAGWHARDARSCRR